MKIQPNSTQLQAVTEHLRYEVEMLKQTADRLLNSENTEFETNVLLESFAIHARALVHFFYPDRIFSTDALADHFITDIPKWRAAIGSAVGAALTDVRTRVNKEIVHLTYDRLGITPVAKGWNVAAIRDELVRLVAKFESVVLTCRAIFGPAEA